MTKSTNKGKHALRRRRARFLESLESRLLLASYNATTASQLTSLLNSVTFGDEIVIPAGTTLIGAWTLKNKGPGPGTDADYITIRSSGTDKLAPGVRVTPGDVGNMARLQSSGGNAPVFKTEVGTRHFKLVGLEIVGPNASTTTYSHTTLLALGSDGTEQSTVESVPHHLVVDRSYLRPYTPAHSIRRAIALNSAHTDITNSWIEEIHDPVTGSDTQGIGGWNGIGPFNIINNRVEGGSENIMFGGSTSRIRPATDVVIRGNHVIKPLHWMSHGDYKVKNLFELKHGSNFLIENNIFENTWAPIQTHAIVLKLGDLDSSPNNVTEDIIFRNNIVRNAAGAIALQGRDYAAEFPNGSPGLDPGGLVRRLTFENNLFYNIGYGGPQGDENWRGTVPAIAITQGPKDVTFNHNTFINVPVSGSNQLTTGETGATAISVDTPQYATSGFKFTNNLIAANFYGVRGAGTASDSGGSGNAAFDNDDTNDTVPGESSTDPGQYFGDANHTFAGNVLMGQGLNQAPLNPFTPDPNDRMGSGIFTDRPNNFFPVNWTAVGLQDRVTANFRLRATLLTGGSNPHKNGALDGTDVGANIDLLEASVKGAATAVFTSDGLNDQFILDMVDSRRFKLDNSPPLPATGDFVDILSFYQSFYFNGGVGNDTLTINFALGSPIPHGMTSLGAAARGVIFDGGDATTSDSLILIGNSSGLNKTTATYTPSATTTGNGTVGAAFFNGTVTTSGNISFSGTEFFNSSGMSGLTLVTPNAADTLSIDTPSGGKYRVSGTSGGVPITPVDSNTSAALTLDLAANDAGSGNDAVTANTANLSSLSVNAGTGSNTLTVNAGTFSLDTTPGIGGVNLDLNIANAGTNVSMPLVQRVRNLSITAGGKALIPAGSGGLLRAATVAIAGAGSQLNLTDNKMIVDYTGATPLGTGVTYSGVSKLLRDGRNGGSWNGAGIVTSMSAAASPSMLTTIGVAESKDVLGLSGSQTGTWNGQTVDATALLIRYTYLGDANVSGTIDGDDFAAIDAGYSGGSNGFYNGDFDYSQKVDADDYFGIDSNYNKAQVVLSPAVQSAPVVMQITAASEPADSEPLAAPIVASGSEIPTAQPTAQATSKSLIDELEDDAELL